MDQEPRSLKHNRPEDGLYHNGRPPCIDYVYETHKPGQTVSSLACMNDVKIMEAYSQHSVDMAIVEHNEHAARKIVGHDIRKAVKTRYRVDHIIALPFLKVPGAYHVGKQYSAYNQ